MSDTTSTEPTTDDGQTETGSSEETTGGSRVGFTRLDSEDLRGILDRLALAALALLALIAAWSFYGHAGTAIRTWLDPAYQPIALAAFNLIVAFLALAGVAHQLYRIRGSDDGTHGDGSGTDDDSEPRAG
ncbi:hypothetical protein J2751_001362 [Halorubrum alkaliphilum]|uniref:DUF8060 domain-containing protein n=1 Tax=Halorubrum alkaliphilum TaxID=261290 RepID=A0A8T4GD05_9EURY|nr:hypothetical protein [Halorubrum alkaliphilum]MBP1922354.1 hypothetical protein [Halorubrum alkaliphilum]